MKISYSVASTPLTAPIRSGAVQPEGVELAVFDSPSTDKNSRDMLDLRYDVAEISMATLVKAIAEGLPLIALPIFSSGRRFVQAGIYFAKGTDLTSPEQLRGRTVGLPQYWLSSCVWQRLVLEQMYGITADQVRWVSTQSERLAGAGVPTHIDWRLESERDLAALIRDGVVDACLMPGGRGLPPALADVTVPAYSDCIAAEREYYLAQGVFPLMHVTVVTRELAEREPGVVAALLTAYLTAKELARSRPDAEWPLPPTGHDRAALQQLLGGDPWPYGVTPNRLALEAFLQSANDQGLVGRTIEPEEIFISDLAPEFR